MFLEGGYDKSRLINFSDAVFSIALTILVLDIDIPNWTAFREFSTGELLSQRIPSFIGFVVSFFVSIIYWISHLRAFKYVKVVDNKVLWLNSMFLFFVVLLPFSTGFYVQGFDYSAPFLVYCLNLMGIGMFDIFLTRQIFSHPENQDAKTKLIGKWNTAVAINGTSVWILAALLTSFVPVIARYLFILIFVLQIFINKYFKRKLMKLNEDV